MPITSFSSALVSVSLHAPRFFFELSMIPTSRYRTKKNAKMSSKDYTLGVLSLGVEISFPRFQCVRNEAHHTRKFFFGNHVRVSLRHPSLSLPPSIRLVRRALFGMYAAVVHLYFQWHLQEKEIFTKTLEGQHCWCFQTASNPDCICQFDVLNRIRNSNLIRQNRRFHDTGNPDSRVNPDSLVSWKPS